MAYMEFSGAYAVYPDDKVLWNLGLSEVDSGRYADGLQHLQLYDAHQHVLDHPTQAKYKVLHEYLQRANLAAGHLSITVPVGARVRVDGREVGVAPVAMPVEAGAHQVEVQTAAGVQTVTVRPSAGRSRRLQESRGATAGGAWSLRCLRIVGAWARHPRACASKAMDRYAAVLLDDSARRSESE